MSRYTAPLARLGKIRSAGITDLRYGNLLDEDWSRTRPLRAQRRPPLVPAAARGRGVLRHRGHHGKKAADLADRLPGDGLVPLDSALGRHANPRRALGFDESRRRVVYGTGHLDLLGREEVYAKIKRWLPLSA